MDHHPKSQFKESTVYHNTDSKRLEFPCLCWWGTLCQVADRSIQTVENEAPSFLTL